MNELKRQFKMADKFVEESIYLRRVPHIWGDFHIFVEDSIYLWLHTFILAQIPNVYSSQTTFYLYAWMEYLFYLGIDVESVATLD